MYFEHVNNKKKNAEVNTADYCFIAFSYLLFTHKMKCFTILAAVNVWLASFCIFVILIFPFWTSVQIVAPLDEKLSLRLVILFKIHITFKIRENIYH